MKKHFLVMPLLGMTLMLSSITASARPVSYPGGWTMMLRNEGGMHSLHTHYSPTFKDSVGYRGLHWSDENINLHAIQYNRLLKRWNQPKSQANFYFKSGLGSAHKNGENDWGSFVGLAADWEDRRYFVSYEATHFDFGKHGNTFNQSARVGFAPYVGQYGDLHTWLMLQYDHKSAARDKSAVTPMVRLFKGPYMFEAGWSNRDDYLLNLIVRL